MPSSIRIVPGHDAPAPLLSRHMHTEVDRGCPGSRGCNWIALTFDCTERQKMGTAASATLQPPMCFVFDVLVIGFRRFRRPRPEIPSFRLLTCLLLFLSCNRTCCCVCCYSLATARCLHRLRIISCCWLPRCLHRFRRPLPFLGRPLLPSLHLLAVACVCLCLPAFARCCSLFCHPITR